MSEQFTALVPMAGRDFATVEDARNWIQTQPPNLQYDLQLQLMEWVMDHRDTVENQLVHTFEWINQSRAYERSGISLADHQECMSYASESVQEIKLRTYLGVINWFQSEMPRQLQNDRRFSAQVLQTVQGSQKSLVFRLNPNKRLSAFAGAGPEAKEHHTSENCEGEMHWETRRALKPANRPVESRRGGIQELFSDVGNSLCQSRNTADRS
jgi:hypothetical protein